MTQSSEFVKHEQLGKMAYRDFADVPTGTILNFGSLTPPVGYLLCNGSLLLTANEPALFAVIGNVFGGDGITDFMVPDLRGRAVVGVGTGSGLTARAMADSDGEENHQLTEAELAAHTHTIAGPTATIATNANQSFPVGSGGSTQSAPTGGDTAHNTMQPFLVVQSIIKS